MGSHQIIKNEMKQKQLPREGIEVDCELSRPQSKKPSASLPNWLQLSLIIGRIIFEGAVGILTVMSASYLIYRLWFFVEEDPILIWPIIMLGFGIYWLNKHRTSKLEKPL